MGRATTRFSRCYCSKCRNKYFRINKDFNWFDVLVIGKAGNAALLKCNKCGHEWKSYSRAAYNKLR